MIEEAALLSFCALNSALLRREDPETGPQVANLSQIPAISSGMIYDLLQASAVLLPQMMRTSMAAVALQKCRAPSRTVLPLPSTFSVI